MFIVLSYHGAFTGICQSLELPPGIGTTRESKMNSSQVRRMIAAGMIGNVLEWYDFAIYGFFALEIGLAVLPP